MGERPPILGVQPADVRRAAPGYRPREPPSEWPFEEGDPDQERVAEQVLEKRLDGVERVWPAQLEQQYAGVRRGRRPPELDHPPVCIR